MHAALVDRLRERVRGHVPRRYDKYDRSQIPKGFGCLCCAVLDEVFNNLAAPIRIARHRIRPHPADILILKHALDAAAFQDGFVQIHVDDVAGINDGEVVCGSV